MRGFKSSTCPECIALERRTFFSLTPAQAVAADKMKLHADEAQLMADRKTISPQVAADRSQLKSDYSTELSVAINQYNADVSAGKLVIHADQINGTNKLKLDRATIAADRKRVAIDRNNAVSEAADLAKLESDRQILIADAADLKNTITADRAAYRTQLTTDRSGITAVKKQTGSLLVTDKNKIVADTKSIASILKADAKVIAADEVQLAEDEAVLFGNNLLNSV